jgi:hypothetical protein
MASHPLVIVISATLVLPLVVLIGDYTHRVGHGFDELVLQAGSDLCLLAFGSVGSVFIDPKVASTFPLPPQLAGVLIVVLIYFFRGMCLRLDKKTPSVWTKLASIGFGLASVFAVGAILVYSYSS